MDQMTANQGRAAGVGCLGRVDQIDTTRRAGGHRSSSRMLGSAPVRCSSKEEAHSSQARDAELANQRAWAGQRLQSMGAAGRQLVNHTSSNRMEAQLAGSRHTGHAGAGVGSP